MEWDPNSRGAACSTCHPGGRCCRAGGSMRSTVRFGHQLQAGIAWVPGQPGEQSTPGRYALARSLRQAQGNLHPSPASLSHPSYITAPLRHQAAACSAQAPPLSAQFPGTTQIPPLSAPKHHPCQPHSRKLRASSISVQHRSGTHHKTRTKQAHLRPHRVHKRLPEALAEAGQPRLPRLPGHSLHQLLSMPGVAAAAGLRTGRPC